MPVTTFIFLGDKMIELRDEFEEFIYYMMNLKRNSLKKMGLYIGQPLILKIIEENPGLPQAELARLAGIKASTLHVMLERMAKNNFVKMKNNEHNFKIKCVYLTDEGKKIQEIACQKIGKVKQKQFEGFSKEEKLQLQSYMERINQNLVNILKEEEEN